MTGDRSLLENFVVKFMGTIRFGNDHFAAITGYGDYVQGNITVCHVHYVEGLGHNLFSVGQFCDGDLEVAFRSNTCYVQNLEGDDLLTRARESNLLSHLNFGTINDLTKHDLVDGLLKFKYGKDHLCYACERGKSKKASHPPKVVPIDDYSRFTWVYILRTKDETPEIRKNFIARVQLNYNAKVHKIRTDNGTEFKNAILKAHYEKLGIMQQFLIARTPQQNGVVERRNRTLVEAARTMLIFSRLPEFLWAEFDELATMASEHDSLEPVSQRFINDYSSAESMNTPSKEDLDNLFGPMYDEYFEKRSSDMSINSTAHQVHNHEDSPSTSSIIFEEHGDPPIVTTSDEQTSPISLNKTDEFNQEDSADFDGNTVFVPYDAPNF
ncbi:retrovirus-related pol polyprotein from transposon TNT 1-94 [Tanacetum coccineum]